jgi:hypothetical protein
MTDATKPLCRSCGAALHFTFLDLGMSPLANSYIKPERLSEPEPFYPLHTYVCHECFLVQLETLARPEDIFTDYAYFSSFSDSWVEHARSFVEMMTRRFRLNDNSLVVEIASNDGYLLQFFVDKGIPVLGIEPAKNVAESAIAKGIPTLTRFFNTGTAAELNDKGVQADLIVGNNVLAHVPDLNGFVDGLRLLLCPRGVVSLEFPHLLRLMEQNQFDTIYHEHFSYFSLASVQSLFSRHGLKIWDVDELSTHGGSLRIFVTHAANDSRPIDTRVERLIAVEKEAGLLDLEQYRAFTERTQRTRDKIIQFLTSAKANRKSVVGYGAPAKGNTLLNYCGVGPDLLEYTVDRSPHKQGHLLPGTHIPIYSPERIAETRPDYVLILPWNLKDEIMDQMKHIRSWNGRFVVPVPEPTVL